MKAATKSVLLEGILLLLLLTSLEAASKDFKWVVFDAGEGLSVLFQTKERGVLIDTGPISHTKEILRKIKKRGVKRLDYLIITHLHADHASGYFDVVEAFPKVKVIESCQADHMKDKKQLHAIERWIAQALQKNKRRRCVKQGDVINSKGVTLSILSPAKIQGADLNRNSLVVHVQKESFNALIMGDADRVIEKQLASDKKTPTSVDLYVAGHHGAADTAEPAFLKMISPTLTVISVNKNNVWGHPDKAAVKRLKQYSQKVLLTSAMGDIDE
jgi:competence protein ComEC